MQALAPIAAAAALSGLFAGPLPAQPYGQQYDQGDAQAQQVLGGVIDAIIGSRYNGGERKAVRRCSFAAVDEAQNQFRPWFRGSHQYAYPNYRGNVRVTAITSVDRRLGGVTVKGLLDTARNGWSNGPGRADLRFRCDADNSGRVTNVRVEPNNWRR